MSELKITIDQLKNYLGTGLKVLNGWGDIIKFRYNHLDDEGNEGQIFGIKPICYCLSDLDKFIPELGFVPIDKMFGGLAPTKSRQEKCRDMMRWPLIMPFAQVKQLFQWHFWPFGDEYFEAGLVIDKLKMTEK